MKKPIDRIKELFADLDPIMGYDDPKNKEILLNFYNEFKDFYPDFKGPKTRELFHLQGLKSALLIGRLPVPVAVDYIKRAYKDEIEQ